MTKGATSIRIVLNVKLAKAAENSPEKENRKPHLTVDSLLIPEIFFRDETMRIITKGITRYFHLPSRFHPENSTVKCSRNAKIKNIESTEYPIYRIFSGNLICTQRLHISFRFTGMDLAPIFIIWTNMNCFGMQTALESRCIGIRLFTFVRLCRFISYSHCNAAANQK